MEPIRVLVISSVVPSKHGLGGELVLHRHLEEDSRLQTEVVRQDRFPLRLKIIGRLKRTCFGAGGRLWESMWPVLPNRALLDERVNTARPDVIITVAHGWWHMAAADAACRHGLPLACFCHDWWPAFPDVSSIARRTVERQVRKTCAASAVIFCVSRGMIDHLGSPPQAVLLHSLPGRTEGTTPTPYAGTPFRVAYFGNLVEYGPLIESALRALRNVRNVHLDVLGPKPAWTPGSEKFFRGSGNYHGLLGEEDFRRRVSGCQAALIVMRFDNASKVRMRTSFPSKLIEAVQFGLPLVVWGPEYCSAFQWARNGNQALCVTDPSPTALCNVLEMFARNPNEQARLRGKAEEAARTDFNPDTIRDFFYRWLAKVSVNRQER